MILFERRFDTSNYDLNRALPKAKIKNVIGSMKDELGGIIMKTLFNEKQRLVIT